MKQIISLAFKYIRRQKLRSLLTFLCITLSVFILCSTFMYMGSTIATFRNFEMSESGSWEVDFGSILDKATKENPADIVKNHSLVEDYFSHESDYIITANKCDENQRISFMDITDDKGQTFRVDYINYFITGGNFELVPDYYKENFKDLNSFDGAVVPSWLQDYGYKIGDTLTFTVNAVSGIMTEDTPEIKEMLKEAEAYYEEKGKKLDSRDLISSYKFRTLFFEKYSFADISLKDEKYGRESETVTVKIAEFNDFGKDTFFIETSDKYKVDFDIDKFRQENAEFLEKRDMYYNNEMYFRVKDGVNFDDAVEQICTDTGISEDDYILYVDSNYEKIFNRALLGFEFKSARGLYEMLPFIVFFLVVIFLAWAIARFVIDNAFEISVQERSRQFASLRVMGASKSQLLALVLTEGIFYAITALPLGFFLAVAICKNVFTSLGCIGLNYFVFEVNPVFIILSLLMCGTAIFVSAYTSALWASRKLSPAEAMNYGKPKRKFKNIKFRRKSKLNRSSKGFIFHYTKKNIKRSRSRFIISSVTMTIGVLMFTFCAISGIGMGKKVSAVLNSYDNSDFHTNAYDISYMKTAEEYLSDSEIFSDYVISCHSMYSPEERRSGEKKDELVEFINPYGDYLDLHSVDRKTYERKYEQYVGATYDEFVASKKLLGVKAGKEAGYKNTAQLGFKGYKSIEIDAQKIVVSGVITVERADMNIGLIYPVENIDIMKVKKSNSYSISIDATVNGEENYAEGEKRFNELCESGLKIEPMTNSYMTNTGLKTFIATVIKGVLGFLVSIWLVGILSMINSINTSVLNRCPELLMLRAVGMSKKQLLGTVVIESISFSAISTIVGTAMGVLFSALFLRFGIRCDINEIVTPAIIIAIASLVINVIIAFLSALPAVNILSRNMKQNLVH